jgi:hypothetical protein
MAALRTWGCRRCKRSRHSVNGEAEGSFIFPSLRKAIYVQFEISVQQASFGTHEK